MTKQFQVEIVGTFKVTRYYEANSAEEAEENALNDLYINTDIEYEHTDIEVS